MTAPIDRKFMKLLIQLFTLALVNLMPVCMQATGLLEYASPAIRHFHKSDYKAGNQNWSIVQDANGFVYVANTNGLLQFDGERWKKYELPGSPIIRAVNADANGRIYTGSLDDFGYWEKDQFQNLHYHNLSRLVDNHSFGDEEIWKIVISDDKVYFQSFNAIYVYNGKTIETLRPKNGTLFFMYKVGARLLVHVIDSGIYQISGDSLEFLPGSQLFARAKVTLMLPFGQDEVLIGQEDGIFYIYNGQAFSPWNPALTKVIAPYKLNKGLLLQNGQYVLGTLLDGIYLLNAHGDIIRHLERDNGLNNNTVLALYEGHDRNLWAGLDNGIDLLKLNAPVYYFVDNTGEIGSVYTAVIKDDFLYLGTNRGAFYAPWPNSQHGKNNFRILPGSQGQVWNLSLVGNTLFCGHNNATYIIDHFKLKTLANVAGGYTFKLDPYDDSILLEGTYYGLAVYKKTSTGWQFSHRIAGFNKLSKLIEFESSNVVWVTHPYKGLYRIELDDSLTKVTDLKEFSPNAKCNVNRVYDEVVFNSDSGVIYYDKFQGKFLPLSDFNAQLGKYLDASKFIQTSDSAFWAFKQGDCAYARLDKKGVFSIEHAFFQDLNDNLIPGYENVYQIDHTKTMVFLDNGYAIFDAQWTDRDIGTKDSIFIRSIKFSDKRGTASGMVEPGFSSKTIPFRFNNLSLEFGYPNYLYDNNRYVSRISGYQTNWSSPVGHGDLSWSNLPYGHFNLQIKVLGHQPETVLNYPFTIQPPWYRRRIADVAFSLLALLLLGFLWFFYYRNLRKIKRKHEQERQELLEKKAEENEKRLIRMRNENLNNEILLKNKQLANSTFSLVHKNNTLINIKKELQNTRKALGQRFPSKHFYRITRLIESNLSSDKDWQLIEQSFNELYVNFFKNLLSHFPDLTPGDLKLCAYLKMNLSSKEIAALLNISTRGVEVRRYRLRKKLHLEHDQNLIEFLMEL